MLDPGRCGSTIRTSTAALLEPRPFDPERPPWDATLIEGLEGGKAALYLRAHHALTDGPGGTALVGALLDPEAEAEPAPDAAAPTTGNTDTSSDGEGGVER